VTLRPALLLLLAVGVPPVAAQAPPDTTSADRLEALLEPLTEEAVAADPSGLLELLEDLRERPLDVNAASAEELALVPALSPRLAEAIVQGRFYVAITDLLRVEGVTPELLAEARPFLTLRPPPARPSQFAPVPSPADLRRAARFEVHQRVQRRLDLPRGYDPVPDGLRGTEAEPARYLGSPERLYTRVRATAGRQLSANLTLEKDPGEPFRWDPSAGFYGYDFASFHLAATGIGRVEALVLGDFVAEFGHGVALWRAGGFGKGREAVGPLVRRGRGLRPYGSASEAGFFRGAAASVALTPDLSVSAFASRRRLDARFDDVDSLRTVSGLPATGLHRTPAEIEQKRALGHTLLGGAAEYRWRQARLGVVGYRSAFDEPLAEGTRPDQRFAFSGREAGMMSVFGSVALGDYDVFAEGARAPGGALGGVGGAEGVIGPLHLLVLARHYPPDFVSLHGYAFGERNGATQNETGVYLGAQARPARIWTVSGYFDQFRFPWARYGVARPSSGHDALLFVEHRPRRWLSVYAQARTKTREEGLRLPTPTGASLDGLAPETRQSLRVQGEFVASRHLRLRTRVEGARYRRAEASAETGTVLFQDLRWTPRPWLSLDARLTHFETGGFGARLYQFENDLLGVLTNALLYGRGTRAYAVAGARPGGRLAGLDLRVKLAQTRYSDRYSVGSGLEAIEGSRVRDLGVQVRYRF
jgi:hypothetical protein